MTYNEFDLALKEINLNKKEFAKIVGMSYVSVTNWKQAGELPAWVDSWITNYAKSKKFDKAKELLNSL